MERYIIPDSPQYSEEIRKLQDTDPASASQIFNPLFARLIENIASVKRQADRTETAASSILSMELTIPAEGWKASPGETGEPGGLCVDIPAELIQEDMTPFLVILPASLETAGSCGLSSAARTLNGFLRVYGERVPEGPMAAVLLLARPSGGMGSGQVATDGEVKEMMDEVFGEKE